ncbi:hypothetical protein Tco_0421459 [Tanacetum coccineum]
MIQACPTWFSESKGEWGSNDAEKFVVVSSAVEEPKGESTAILNEDNVTNSPTSYTKLVTGKPSRKSMNFCTLVAPARNRADVAISVDSKDGMDAMLENGPWFIRNNPFILKKSDLDVFGHVLDECPKNIVFDVVKNMKNLRQAARCVQENSKSARKRANSGVSLSNHGFFHVASTTTSTTPIVERIDKLERQIIDGKLTLVDDNEKPLPKVVSMVHEDSDNEVEDVLDGTMEVKKCDDDYDPSDDDMYESHEMSKNLHAIYDDFDIMVCGRKKK